MKLKDFMSVVDDGSKIEIINKDTSIRIGFIEEYNIAKPTIDQIDYADQKYQELDFINTEVLNVAHSHDHLIVSVDPIFLEKRLKFKDIRYMIHAEKIGICTREYTEGILDFVGTSTEEKCDKFNGMYVAHCFPSVIHGSSCIIFILRSDMYNRVKEGSTTKEDPWIDGAEFSIVHGC